MTTAEAQLARIESKLDKITDDHENRLRTLERWIWAASGTAILSLGAGAVSVVNVIASAIAGG